MHWVRLSSHLLAGKAKMTLCKHNSRKSQCRGIRLIVSNPTSLTGTSFFYQLYFKFMLGSSTSSLSSSSAAGTAPDQLHPGGQLHCACVLCAGSLPISMSEAGLRWWASNCLVMSWVNCPERLQRPIAHRFSAAASLGLCKHGRNPSWKYKLWVFFQRLLQDFLRTWERPTRLWRADH